MAEKRKHPTTAAKEARRKAAIEERQRQAYRLWLVDKKPYREIGDILGICHEQARKDIRAEMERQADEFNEEIRLLKAKQIVRLMRQYDRWDAIASNVKLDVYKRAKAGQLCLGVLKELNDVMGVKAAVKVEHSGAVDLAIDVTNKIDAIYGPLEEQTIDA